MRKPIQFQWMGNVNGNGNENRKYFPIFNFEENTQRIFAKHCFAEIEILFWYLYSCKAKIREFWVDILFLELDSHFTLRNIFHFHWIQKHWIWTSSITILFLQCLLWMVCVGVSVGAYVLYNVKYLYDSNQWYQIKCICEFKWGWKMCKWKQKSNFLPLHKMHKKKNSALTVNVK